MQTINREKITRYFTQKESTGSGGGSGDSGDLIAWVNDNFVSKNFFNQLFTIHGHDEDDTSTPPEDVIVTPNDTQTIIDSIEAMFDFYSEKAISALGLNSQGGGGGASTLADLNDVDLTTPTNGQVLMYNSTTGKWYNGTVQGGGGGTVTSIVAGTGLSGGTITTSGTIALSSETQTNIGYGVTAYGWGNHANAGYLTSSDISDMATQTWVGQNYLGLHSTADKATKLATARTLWGQSFDGTANVTGSLTDVINITGSGTLHRFTSMELNSQGDLSGYGGYIDYHYNGGGTDYTSRLVEESVGVLTLKAKTAADVTTLAGLIVGSAVDGSFVQVGSVRLVYDSTNNAIKVVGSDGTTAANFYATGAVSALGANSQSGGGGLTMDDVWDALGNGSGPDGGRQINASHVSYALFGYATQTWVNNQAFAKGVKVGSTTYSPDSNGIVDLGTISSTDTKNTVGSTTLNATQLYLVITSAPASGGTYTQSYINTNCYIGTDNCLYSNGTKVLTSEQYHGTVTSVVIGSGGTPISPVNGVVTLPAYPTVTDTKNTAGSTALNATKLFIIGANTQAANPQTYSNTNCYIGTDNCLYSGGSKVLTGISSSDVTTALGYTPAATSDLNNYLPLTGGTMTGSIKWPNNNKGTASANQWDIYTQNYGIEILCVGNVAGTGAPGRYSAALHVSGTYWFQMCYTRGGGDKLYWRGGNTEGAVVTWKEVIHEGNISSYALPSTGGTLSGALTISSGDLSLGNGNVSVAGTATFAGNVTASGFVVPNSTGFLKADGSVDSTTYLPTTGGTISGTTDPLTLSSTSANSYLNFGSTQNSVLATRATAGYANNFAFISNAATNARIGVSDDGTPQYWPGNSPVTTYTLIHSGNVGNFGYLPLTGGTMTGNIAMGMNGITFSSNNTSDWNLAQHSGIRILNYVSSTTPSASSGIPTVYTTGLSVHGYYGFQLAMRSSDSARLQVRNLRVNSFTLPWKEVAYTDDLSSYASAIVINNDQPVGASSGVITLSGIAKSISLTSGGTSLTPSASGVITMPAASASEYGVVKVNSVYGQAVTLAASGQSSTRNYGLQLDSNGKAFVYVPWDNSITSSDVTTALGFTPAASSDLANYLPLAGGEMSGRIKWPVNSGNVANGWNIFTSDAGICIFNSNINGTGSKVRYSTALHVSGKYWFQLGHMRTTYDSLFYRAGTVEGVTKDWSAFVFATGTSSQFIKGDGSLDSNTYLTSGDVVTVATDQTVTGKKTFTTQFTTNGNAALTKGAKFYSICVETDSTGAFDSAREGEINRFGSNDLHLQYASGTGGVTVCQSKLKFSLVQGVVNMTTNSAALYLNTGSTAPTTAVAWSTTSDIRRKDVIRNVDARIEQIAEAPIFDYYLKGGDKGQPFLGTSAQYWLGVFPNAVRMGYDSFYGQDYGATALAAAVITARKVVNHEERIAALERENEELRKELELLKAA